MNQAAVPVQGGFLRLYEAARDRLPGDPAVRAAAAAGFATLGLPGRTDEAWRYTSLRPLFDAEVQAVDGLSTSVPELGDMPDLPLLVMVQGRYEPALSCPPPGLSVRSFAEHPVFGALPALPMVSLNTMLAEDGVQLHVEAGVDAGTVVLLSVSPDVHRPVGFHPRHMIRLEAGARLTVIEIGRGAGTYLHNAVTEVSVAEGAALTHVRLQQESLAAFHVATTVATVAADGAYDAFVLTLGGRLSRAEVHARLDGPRAAVHLNGAQLLSGSQHADISTVVRHAAPNCASRQTIKNVLDGQSRGVFQGKIEVDRVAQKTDGYQMSQALLLSGQAEIDVKPQLEIYADDVKCSHGATMGALDPDQMFYLRSRGVPEAAARAMLVRAFLTEALEAVAEGPARTMLEGAIETWWEQRAA